MRSFECRITIDLPVVHSKCLENGLDRKIAGKLVFRYVVTGEVKP